MPFVTIQASDLTHEKKERLAAHIAQAFQALDIPPQAVLLKFEDLHLEYVTDSGLRCMDLQPPPRAQAAPAPLPSPTPAPQMPIPAPASSPEPVLDQNALRDRLLKLLPEKSPIGSLRLQAELGLKGQEAAGRHLAGALKSLIAEGMVRTSGQKRGMLYHWVVDAAPVLGSVLRTPRPQPEAAPEAPLQDIAPETQAHETPEA